MAVSRRNRGGGTPPRRPHAAGGIALSVSLPPPSPDEPPADRGHYGLRPPSLRR